MEAVNQPEIFCFLCTDIFFYNTWLLEIFQEQRGRKCVRGKPWVPNPAIDNVQIVLLMLDCVTGGDAPPAGESGSNILSIRFILSKRLGCGDRITPPGLRFHLTGESYTHYKPLNQEGLFVIGLFLSLILGGSLGLTIKGAPFILLPASGKIRSGSEVVLLSNGR